MAHQIYAGPFEALETRLLDQIAGTQKADPLAPVALLVGSNVLASYLKYRIAERGRAVANLRFHTFLDLAAGLAAPSPPDRKKPRLPRLGPSFILETILRQDAPSVFKEISVYPGFRAALLDTFRDLRDAGVAPEKVWRAIRENSRADRKEHLDGVARLFQEFRGKTGLFREVDDDFREALSNAPRARDILGCDHLFIYGVYDVTGQQEDLLNALKETLQLIYFVPYCDEDSSVFAKPFLEARAKELSVVPEFLEPPSDGRSSVMRRGLFDTKVPQTIPAGALMLILAPGESRVAVEIVREILRAVRDGIICGFHEAAILLRHPESEVPVLSEAFRLRKIPYYLHGGVPFSQRPLTRAVRAIASLEADGFSRQAIFRAMEWIAAAMPEGAAGTWDVPQWRALTNNPVFLSGVQSWDLGTEALIKNGWRELKGAEEVAAWPSEPAHDEAPEKQAPSVAQAQKRLEAARALKRAWSVLRSASANWPQRLSWEEWAKLLEERLEPLLGNSDDWEAFTTVLDEVGSLSGVAGSVGPELTAGRGQMENALQEAMESLSLPQGRFQRGGVNILSVTAARGLRFPLVVVPGLEEGNFPSRLRQDPFLLDEERRSIGKLPLKSLRVEEEKLLFDMAARSAERRLVLIASRLDENSDRERIPSDFFLRAASTARAEVVGYNDLQEGNIPGLRSVRLDSPAPPEREVVVDEGEIRLRLITAYSPQGRALDALAELEPQRLRGPRAFDQARWKGSLTPFDGRLRDPALVRWVAARFGASAGPVSASRLEEFARCPYLFFLKRVFGLEKWEEVEGAESIAPLERGRAIHEILEGFLKEFAGEQIAVATRAALFASLDRRAVRRLNEARPAGIPDLLWEIERDRLLEMLHNWLEYELKRLQDGFLPFCFELAFGDFSSGQSSPAYRVHAGNFVFDFRGRIDRLDLSRDGTRARVLDYKVGSLPSTMTGKPKTPLMGGEKLQIAVYGGALSALPEFSAVREVRGEYLHLQPKNGTAVPCSLDGEVLAEARKHLPGILEVIGEAIEGGVFFARTSGSVRPGGHCEFCGYLTICGKDRTQREERKSGDPAVSRFVQMRMLDGASEEEE